MVYGATALGAVQPLDRAQLCESHGPAHGTERVSRRERHEMVHDDGRVPRAGRNSGPNGTSRALELERNLLVEPL